MIFGNYAGLFAIVGNHERGISRHRLLKCSVDNKTLDTIKKGGNITMLTLEKICSILDCTPNDVLRFEK